jgi:segregation and condensation protein B
MSALNSNLEQQIEAVLFISPRPLSVGKLANLLEVETVAIEQAVAKIKQAYAERQSGLAILQHGAEVQMVTDSVVSELVQKFLKEEMTGELSKPSVETLTIIAYRGPITKSEVERIRGVNCSLILRNLMIRGLVQAEEDKKRLITYYTISADFLRHLGLTSIQDLPQYTELHNPEVVERLLAEGVNDVATS